MGDIAEQKKMGRPSTYRPEMCTELVSFFDVDATKEIESTFTAKNGSVKVEKKLIPVPMPTFEEFAWKHGISVDALSKWSKRYPLFGGAYARAKEKQKELLIKNGLLGLYNSQFAIFCAQNMTDMRQQVDVALSGSFSVENAFARTIDVTPAKKGLKR